MANSFTLLADLKAGRCSTTTAVLLISKKAGGVGLNMTAASNDSWWTPAIEEEEIMRIHRIQHKRIRNHMEQPTAIYVLKAGLHSVVRMTDFKYLATFPCGAVPFTAEEERPPDLSCDGAAKKYEYVRVNRIRLRISHPSIVVAAVGGQVIETKLRSLDRLSKKKKKQHQTIH
ncbi:unnamed protein product [Brassica oleracea]|uniref:(rape) hypothetical protein n=1 Tax=Brassica napus TaxID=3708 RepID=A0A816JN24_BRANA|nr:unnamed protein product [Brassica napus]